MKLNIFLSGILLGVSSCCGSDVNHVQLAVVPREGLGQRSQFQAFLPANDSARLRSEAWHYGGVFHSCRLYDLALHPERFTFESSDSDVAVVDNSGAITTLGPGEAIISSIVQSVAGQLRLRVSPVVQSLRVSTPRAVLPPDDTLRIDVVAEDANGVEVPGVWTWVALVPPTDSVGRWAEFGFSWNPTVIQTPEQALLVVERIGPVRITAYTASEPGWPEVAGDTTEVVVRIRRVTPGTHR